ncbi:MAG: hypothetical protein MSG64_03125 [Pyrinomonadaceae bacterium MAG19_C2-C3]|nr:hypothetical protein [Pyrinomonadaceae bacterium MAG19_C2-C3]
MMLVKGKMMTTKTATKTPRKAVPKPRANGDGQSAPTTKTRKRRELTLEEMSLRAYKMTYERLHGKGKKAATKKAKPAPDTAKLPKAA